MTFRLSTTRVKFPFREHLGLDLYIFYFKVNPGGRGCANVCDECWTRRIVIFAGIFAGFDRLCRRTDRLVRGAGLRHFNMAAAGLTML